MPRFPEESVACLRRFMLSRAEQDFKFTSSDVEAIMKETRLEKAQVQAWADQFRFRSGFKSRDEILASLLSTKKAESVKTKRFFLHCFDATCDLVPSFKFIRQEKKSEVPIQFMTASFDEIAGSCEFLVEFTEQVVDDDVEKCFYAHGAKGVNVLTFGNDKGRGAAVAYTRITDLQAKTGLSLSRGEISKSLVTSLESLKKSQKEEKTERDFNEKTRAAEKISLDEFKSKMEEVHDEVQGLGHFQQGIKEDVLSIGNNVQSHAVKLEAIEDGVQLQAVNLVDIKQGVCNVIPDYQQEIKNLRDALAYKTRQCDIQESKTAAQTGKVNQRDKEIDALHRREEAYIKREESLLERIKELEAIVQLKEMLQEERAYARFERAELKQSIAEVQESAKILGDMLSLEEERAAKRQRA